MEHVTSTSPNWVVQSESQSSENAKEVEQTAPQVEVKEQPRPEHLEFDNSSPREQVIDKVDKEMTEEAEANRAKNVQSTDEQLNCEDREVSIEKNLLMTDDGEGDLGNDSRTSADNQNTEKIEQEKIPEQEFSMAENVASPAQHNKNTEEESIEKSQLKAETEGENDGKVCIDQLEEKNMNNKEVTKDETNLVEMEASADIHIGHQETSEKPEENIMEKKDADGDDGTSSTGQQEEIPKQGNKLVEDAPTHDKQIDHQETEEKPQGNLMGKEDGDGDDGNDGRACTGQQELHMVEQTEILKEEIRMVESKQSTEDQENFEEEIEGIEQKLSELSFQEIEQRGDDACHTEANATESKEKVSEQEPEEQKNIPFQETYTDGDHETVQDIVLENHDKPTQVIEAVLEVENVSDLQAEREQENPIPEIEINAAQCSTATESEKDIEKEPTVSSNVEVDKEDNHINQPTEPLEIRKEEIAEKPVSEEPVQSCNPVEEAIYSEIVTTSEMEDPPVNHDVEVRSPTPPSTLPIATTSPSAKVNTTPPADMLHHIKNIQFKDKNVGIVTQNENGPCPLVAIINVLLLRRQITLPAHSEIVAAAKLMEHIGDAMLESVPKNLSGEVRLNYEQNMHDAMAVLPKLQTGLDVNVKFTGVRDFEYTPECIIFDLLRVPLFHGWLVDPQAPEVVSAVGQAGYNQLVEKVISQKCSNDENAVLEALVIENFLERSASQLTYHGLSELITSMEDDEIGVLFRNNHFSTIYKHQKELLQLVTDQGFLGEPSVVWETLCSIDGDGQFVDSHFRTVPPKPELAPSGESASPNASAQLTAEQQIDHDFLVALSLQEEQQQQDQPAAVQEEVVGDVGEDVAKTLTENERTSQEQRDLELARQLQLEERHAAEAEAETVERETSAASSQQSPATGQRSPPPQSSKKKDCTIL